MQLAKGSGIITNEDLAIAIIDAPFHRLQGDDHVNSYMLGHINGAAKLSVVQRYQIIDKLTSKIEKEEKKPKNTIKQDPYGATMLQHIKKAHLLLENWHPVNTFEEAKTQAFLIIAQSVYEQLQDSPLLKKNNGS